MRRGGDRRKIWNVRDDIQKGTRKNFGGERRIL